MAFHILFSGFIIVMTCITAVRRLLTALKNHSEIQESISLLMDALGEPNEEYHPTQDVYDRFLADISDNNSLTSMAYDILNHCRKQPWNIRVNRVDNLGKHTAGLYRKSGESGEILVRVGDDASWNIIISVLIHECMHHFLMMSGIEFRDSHKNEVLTDTAALYLGFSEYMNRGQIGVGYLSYSELLYAEKLIGTQNEMDEIIKLRPHHLLCTQGYSGKGYSDDFVSNMDSVTNKLRNDRNVKVEIVFSTDSLGSKCPSKVSNGVCKSDNKVLRFDTGVINALNLKEGVYSYQELISRLDEYLSSGVGDERLRAICGDCEWYPVSACWKNIRDKKYVI